MVSGANGHLFPPLCPVVTPRFDDPRNQRWPTVTCLSVALITSESPAASRHSYKLEYARFDIRHPNEIPTALILRPSHRLEKI